MTSVKLPPPRPLQTIRAQCPRRGRAGRTRTHGRRTLRYVRRPRPAEPVYQAAAGGHRAGAHEDLLARLLPGAGARLGPGVARAGRQAAQVHRWLQAQPVAGSAAQATARHRLANGFRSQKHVVLVSLFNLNAPCLRL